jgi:quinol monooxygenase YgiN
MNELVLVVQVKIKTDCVPQLLAELEKNATAARETEPGCLQFDVIRDPDDPTRLMLYEVYADAAAFEAHQNSAHFKHYLAVGVPLLESRERRFYRRAMP